MRLSRREQRGWSGARGKAQPPQSGGGFCPSRSEAARREQAKRRCENAFEPSRTARMERSEGKSPAAAKRGRVLPEPQRSRAS